MMLRTHRPERSRAKDYSLTVVAVLAFACEMAYLNLLDGKESYAHLADVSIEFVSDNAALTSETSTTEGMDQQRPNSATHTSVDGMVMTPPFLAKPRDTEFQDPTVCRQHLQRR
jgi:hypothetical protein